MGRASGGSLAVFYDHGGGEDDYGAVQGRDNGMVVATEAGGVLVDR